MYKTISFTAALILILSTSTLAEFPAEEVWSVEFDTTVTCLGPNWQEDGQTHFLVGLENQAVIVSDGEIVWESPEFGTEQLPELVTALSRIDFRVGDGPELIISTIQLWDDWDDEVWVDTGKVYLFSGEDYEDLVVRTPFIRGISIEADGDGGRHEPTGDYLGYDNREVKQIHVFSDILPDSTKRIITCNKDYYSSVMSIL